MQLYYAISKLYKKISLDAFNFHIKKMINNRLIDKNDTGARGKKVYYFLTEKAKQQKRLKILASRSQEEKIQFEMESEVERRQKLYFLLLWFRQNWKPVYRISDERDLDNLLSMVGSSKKDLEIGRIRDEFEGDEHIIYITFKPISDVVILKDERFKESNKENRKIRYHYVLPGVSVRDILEAPAAFEHINFTHSEVQDTFNLAVKEGLLRAILFDDEIRYVIADPLLDKFLGDLWHLFCAIFNKMEKTWNFIRSPTQVEIKLLELFYGIKATDEMRINAYRHRHSLRGKKKKRQIKKVKKEIENIEQDIDEYVSELKEEYTSTVGKYQFPTEKILEIIYPKSVQRTN
jgi:hypothetical protein